MPRNFSQPRATNNSPICRARQRKGMTQRELADAIGISTITLQTWESGRYHAPLIKLIMIAEVLDVDVRVLVEPEPTPEPDYYIAKIRRAKGMTQAQLAEAIGRSRIQVSNYESGAFNPPPEILDKIASVLGVSMDQLRTGQYEPNERYTIVSARKAKGVSQVQLAEATGISQTMISRYENGLTIPPDEAIAKIATALGTTVEALKEPKKEQDNHD